MELGSTNFQIYAGGAIGVGLLLLAYALWTKIQVKASRERLRRIRRTLEGIR